MTVNCDAIILGAGITGLSCAYYLEQAGLNTYILESESACGGRIRSSVESNYLLEAGPNTLQSKDTELWDLVHELGLESQLEFAPSNARRRWIVRNGELRLLPSGPTQLLTSKALSWGGILRAAAEPFLNRVPHPDDSVEKFVFEHFGREVCDYLLNPFVRGIYAGEPRQLSVRAAFPKLFEAATRKGSVVRGLFGVPRSAQRRKRAPASIYTFSGGIVDLISALRAKLSGSIEIGTQALNLRPDQQGYYSIELAGSSRCIRSKRVILTVPGETAAKLISDLDPQLAQLFANLEYPPLAVVHSAYKRSQVQHALDGFGFLAPAVEKRFVLGTLFSSSLAKGRAPSDEVLLTSMVGGASEPEKFSLSDDEIVRRVGNDLEQLLGASGAPVFSKVTRWQHSIPQYSLDQLELCKRIAEFEAKNSGLYFVGNFRDGVSVGACVRGSKKLAERLAAYTSDQQIQHHSYNKVQNG